MDTWLHQGPRKCLRLYNHQLQHQEDIKKYTSISSTRLQPNLLLDLHWYLSILLTSMPYWRLWKKSLSTQCPCTKTVRDSNQICQIPIIWWSVPLPLTMYLIVEIMASPPAMNTHSKKHHLPHDHPVHQDFKNGMAILNTSPYFFTLPNTLGNHTYVHLVQWDTCLYDSQDLEPEELAERMRIKKNQARRRKLQRIRGKVEKLVQL